MLKGSLIVKRWLTPKFPEVHISRDSKKELDLSRYLRKWLVHPIKRRIAKYYLYILRKLFGVRVIGITGSAGKTSVKDMLTSVLSLDGDTVSSYKNIDPVYNIPTTILKCRPSTKYLILEMGVEYPGEMDFYLWLTKPDIGVITNIYPTHTEYFKDVEGVFREKRKLIEGLSVGGTAVLNNENKFLRRLLDVSNRKTITFGRGGNMMSARVSITKNSGTRFLMFFNHDYEKGKWVTIPTYGRQFVSNAIAAAATAKSLGVSLDRIKSGLETYKPPEHRMSILNHKSGAVIIDDTYNNNPQAAREAIKVLSDYAGNNDKIVIFGDMLELGSLTDKYHRKIGKILAKNNLKRLICIGKSAIITAESASELMARDKVNYISNRRHVENIIKPYLKDGTYILIKGSRSLEMEKLVHKLWTMK